MEPIEANTEPTNFGVLPQVVVETIIPKMVLGLPGMPQGVTCEVEKDSDDLGWAVHIRLPA